jgi:hypothetical protein|nr:MAG TPA: hypothetical protein [Caudoviricetes sp.]
MSSNESPYLKYGLGFEEDERVIGSEPFHQDVLNLAEYLLKKFPKERVSIMHYMFQIGFNCGQRSMGDNSGLDEILKEAETFKTNMNTTVIEMDQIAQSLDIVLEHIEVLRTGDKEVERAVNLLDVLVRSLTDCCAASEDSVTSFERFISKSKQKNMPTSSANEVSNS